MNDTVDLLKIKIEKAREELPEDTLAAIDAVDWRDTILRLRETKGYNIEQLGDLEIETELVLSGLVNPANYQKELETRMGIGKAQAAELVQEMNELVFKKIKEKLVEISEQKKLAQPKQPMRDITAPSNIAQPIREIQPKSEIEKTDLVIDTGDGGVLESAGITMTPTMQAAGNVMGAKVSEGKRQDILESVEHPPAVHPILGEKILGKVQTEAVKTEYGLGHIPKTPAEKTVESQKATEAKPEPPKVTEYPKGTDPYRLSPDE